MKRAIVAAGVAAVALMAAGCGSSAASSSGSGGSGSTSSPAAAAPVTLRLGFLTNITHATALVGVKEGFFTKDLGNGVTLKLAPFSTGTRGGDRAAGRPARRGLRRPEPGDQGLADLGRQADQDHLRGRLRRGRAGGQEGHHQPGPAQGPVAGHPVARQHPGRGAALLAEAARPDHHPDRRRRRADQADRRRTRPPCSRSSPARSPAAGSPRPTTPRWSRPAGTCWSTRPACGRRGSSSPPTWS